MCTAVTELNGSLCSAPPPPPTLGAIVVIVLVGVLAVVVVLVILIIVLVYICRLKKKIAKTRPEAPKLRWTDVTGEVKLDIKVSPREEDSVHGYLSLSHTQRISGVFQADGTDEPDGRELRLISVDKEV